jgi:hypothetical protein
METEQDFTDLYMTHTKTAIELALQTCPQYSDGTHSTGTVYMPWWPALPASLRILTARYSRRTAARYTKIDMFKLQRRTGETCDDPSTWWSSPILFARLPSFRTRWIRPTGDWRLALAECDIILPNCLGMATTCLVICLISENNKVRNESVLTLGLRLHGRNLVYPCSRSLPGSA